MSTGHRIGDAALHPDAVRRILAHRVALAGVTVAGFETLSAHLLRSGFITEAYGKGVRDEDIMRHTRHRDLRTMRGYVRRPASSPKAPPEPSTSDDVLDPLGSRASRPDPAATTTTSAAACGGGRPCKRQRRHGSITTSRSAVRPTRSWRSPRRRGRGARPVAARDGAPRGGCLPPRGVPTARSPLIDGRRPPDPRAPIPGAGRAPRGPCRGLVGRSRACPFDLHSLLPVPARVLELDPTHPAALAWLSRHRGVTDSPRQVAERPHATMGGRLPGGHRVIGYSFFTGGETPDAAISQLRLWWPALRFLL